MEMPDLRPYIKRYDSEAKDYEDFERISTKVKEKTFLKKQELLTIAEWKLRKYWHRGNHEKNIKKNQDSVVEEITRKAIKETDDKKKIEILDTLKGVGIPVASSILTMLNPKRYAIIDVNGWYALYGKEKKPFSSDDFIRYIRDVREICRKQNLTAREVDRGIFILGKDKRNKRRSNKKIENQ